MNHKEILQRKINASNKASVASELGITISHLNNLLSGRKTFSKHIQYKLENENNDYIIFEVDKGTYMEKLFNLLCECDEKQVEKCISLLENNDE